MAISRITLDGIGPFLGIYARRPEGRFDDGTLEPDIAIDFHPRINLLVGPNNTGKSTILEMVNVLVSREFGAKFSAGYFDEYDHRGLFDEGMSAFSVEWTSPLGHHRLFQFAGNEYPGTSQDLGIDARIVLDGGTSVLGPEEMDNWTRYASEHGYVGYYNPKWFDAKLNYVPIDFVYDRAWADLDLGTADDSELHQSIGREIRNYLNDVDPDADRDLFYARNIPITVALEAAESSVAKDVLRDIQDVVSAITGGFIEELGMNFDGERVGRSRASSPNHDHRTSYGLVHSYRVSQGTTSVIQWVTYFMYHMARHYRGAPGWKDMPGFFIIDEIDAHLHPSWQRRIIPTLRRHFPNVQIIASTHSPLMVAGLDAGQVHLLERDETGRVTWSRNEDAIIGWTADEIYRTFMGIDDPTDEATADAANKLRELRSQGPLEDEQAEEKRQASMAELRKRVNRDMLAGGAFEAQRLVFAEQVIELLGRRRQDRDLNQENG